MKDMLGREKALTTEEALNLLLERESGIIPVEPVHIDAGFKRVLSQDLYSPENLPGFTRSTMDGYAVKASDTFGASDRMPVYLELKGQVLMGKKPDTAIAQGEACQIPTGGMLPEGADAVVMFEHTNTIDGKMLEVMKALFPGENVVQPDEDIKEGEIVLEKGHRLRAQDIGALAGLGITELEVYKKPTVAVIGTGDEVVPPGNALSPGEVRDINSYNLSGLIQDCNAIPVRKGIVRDDFGALKEIVQDAVAHNDMVLITGGSSVGTKDYTLSVINELGKPGVLFHGVAVKPGKPLIGGFIDHVPVLGLPGHPAAITVCFETFIEPLLLKLSGEKKFDAIPRKKTVKALLTKNLSSPIGREEHVRVTLEQKNDKLLAVPILGKSALIRTLVKAHGTIVVPMNTSGLYEGDEVDVSLFRD